MIRMSVVVQMEILAEIQEQRRQINDLHRHIDRLQTLAKDWRDLVAEAASTGFPTDGRWIIRRHALKEQTKQLLGEE